MKSVPIHHAYRLAASQDHPGDPRMRRTGARGRGAAHDAVGAEPSGQGAGGPGRGRAVRAPVEAPQAVGGGPAALARGRAHPARDRRGGRGIPRAAVGADGAASHRHRMPCLFRLALPGARTVPPRLARGRRGHPPRPRLRGDGGADARGGRSGDLLRPREARRDRLQPALRLCADPCRLAHEPAGRKALHRGGGSARPGRHHLSGGPDAA